MSKALWKCCVSSPLSTPHKHLFSFPSTLPLIMLRNNVPLFSLYALIFHLKAIGLIHPMQGSCPNVWITHTFSPEPQKIFWLHIFSYFSLWLLQFLSSQWGAFFLVFCSSLHFPSFHEHWMEDNVTAPTYAYSRNSRNITANSLQFMHLWDILSEKH